MREHADKPKEREPEQESTNRLASGLESATHPTFDTPPPYTDNRPGTLQMRSLQHTINNSPQVLQRQAMQEAINNSPQVRKGKAMKEAIDNSPQVVQAKARQEALNNSPRMRGEMPITTANAPVQRKPKDEEGEERKATKPFIPKFDNPAPSPPIQRKPFIIQRQEKAGGPAEDAQALYEAISGWTTDKDKATIFRILEGKSPAYLKQVRMQYH